MKEKTKRLFYVILSWLPAILCAAGIFLLSAQNGADSAALSGETMLPFARILIALFGENGHNVFRKFAHFFAYFLLMLLTYRACCRTRKTHVLSPVLPYVLCVLYAVSDEIHQFFVPERACRLFDVGVDALGALVGGLCFYLLYLLIQWTRNRKNRKRKEPKQ